MVEPVTPKDQMGFFASTRPDPLVTPFKGTTCADDARQTAVRKHLGLHNNNDMFLADVDPFLGHYLPSEITDEVIEQCVEEILTDHPSELESIGNKLSWTKYQVPPSEFETNENATFKHLGAIIETIITHNPLAIDPEQKPFFRLCPDNWVVGDIEGGGYKIDACFTEVEQKKQINNRHATVPFEFKQERTSAARMTVHQQILGASHHILNEDPRRMWIFGLTFEDALVSVWYFSRSHSVKTFAMNWLQDPRLLIKIILKLANAGHTALGIDPMVHIGPLSADKKTVSYVYEVPPAVKGGASIFYKTGQIRSPPRPMCIAGRVTRVWEVTQVTSANGNTEVKPVKKAILKDVWLDAGTSTETENVDKIFTAVDTFVSTRLEAEIRDELKKHPRTSRKAITSDSQTMKRLMKQLVGHEKRFEHFDDATKERLCLHLTDKNYRSMFLTKLHDWKGLTSKELEPSARRCPNLFPGDPDVLKDDKYAGTKAPSVARSKARNQQGRVQSGLVESIKQSQYTSLAKQDAQDSRGYVSKQQTRVVYEEVCDSLYEMKTLGDVFDILCQAIDAAHILYAVGWVHRDLSAGNILALKTGPNQTWSVKLADFEFARLMIDEKRKVRSDPRTGTAFFMPTEILDRHYLYENYFIINKLVAKAPPTLLRRGPVPNSDNNTLTKQFNIPPSHPAYSKLNGLKRIPCLDMRPTLPPNADPTKIPTRGSIVNHNFQHDLESIWWILFWFVTMNVNWALSFDWAHDIFTHDISKFEPRWRLFTTGVVAGKSVFDCLRPELATDFPNLLEILRSRMETEYIQRQIFGHLEVPESYSEIQGDFSEAFRRFAAIGGDWRNLEIKCGVNPKVMDFPKPIATGSKHARDEDEPRRTRSGMAYGNKKTKTGN